jgi:hypothetical protein
VFALAVGLIPALAACGSDTQFSDSDIVGALKLKRISGGPYSIGGDPFCEVDGDLLNDKDEIELAKEGSGVDLVITNSDESAGVQAVPPFDPACARQARRDLDQLE